MYDYELEKSLEERQAEDLDFKLKRNRIKINHRKKVHKTYNVIKFIVVLSILICIVDIVCGPGVFIFIVPIFTVLLSIALLAYVNQCPFCSSEIYLKGMDWEIILSNRCSFCGERLIPSEHLKKIEERRKKEKSGGKSDSD